MFLAALPYAVRQLDRGIRSVLRFGGVWLLIFVLAVVALVPLLIEGARQQPLNQSVDDLRDGTSGLSGWVRLYGDIVDLDTHTGAQSRSLLINESGDAILLVANRSLADVTMVTGHVALSSGLAENIKGANYPGLPDDLDIVDSYLVNVDDQIVPPENRSWAESWVPGIAAALLLAGMLAGYPLLVTGRGAPRTGGPVVAEGEAVPVRLVDRADETGLRSSARPATFQRVARAGDEEPFFRLVLDDEPGSVDLYRHAWSWERPGTLWFVTERMPVLTVHDWGLDLLLGFDSQAARDRVLATLAAVPPQPNVARRR
jgi:hypothetical protein